MKLLLLGSGGREHALAWKLAESPTVDLIYAAPGNPGLAGLPKCRLVDLSPADSPACLAFAQEQGIDLTVVGPEAPLVAGLADAFAAAGLKVFGPSKGAAQLEGSKAFSKALMAKYHIPTARFKVCTSLEEAQAYVRQVGAPIVVKADGLAAGKGVVVALSQEEALQALKEMMGEGKYGQAGAKVVLEEYLEGEEASLLAFTDGRNVVPMIASQDHKRAYDGDRGPNTGGMGSYAPAPVVTEEVRRLALETILQPTVAALAAEGLPYRGCLYAGLMIHQGRPKVVEFNCRFGDPETQVVLPLLEGDLAQLMLACAEGRLGDQPLAWKPGAAVCVVLASDGYPGSYAKGRVIHGLEEAAAQGALIFHAGTAVVGKDVVTAGGRVLGVTATAATIQEARDAAYAAAGKISFEGAFYRQDIAWRALKP